jgi:hypothetical protein
MIDSPALLRNRQPGKISLLILLVGVPLFALMIGTAPLFAHPFLAPHPSAQLSLSAVPDLVIAAIELEPPEPAVGATVDITVTIKNQGDSPAPAFRAYMYVNPADQPPLPTTSPTAQTFLQQGLQPGDTFLFARTGVQVTESALVVFSWVDR